MLTDTTFGRHKEFDIEGHQTTWTIISRGHVSIALNQKWKQAWQNAGTHVQTDGKQQHCRVMMIQIPCYRRLGVSLVAVYSPSSKATRAEVDEHLADIEHVAGKCRPRHTLIIGGDFNSETGVRDAESGSTMGPHGTGKRNHRGRLLVQMCKDHNWSDAHSWTGQKNKETWRNPRWRTYHLLDHFLVPRGYIRNVKRVLTIHEEVAFRLHLTGWGEYTDHKPVELAIRLAPPAHYKQRQQTHRKLALHKGRGNTDEARQLREQYHDRIQTLMDSEGPPQTWPEYCALTQKAAAQVFGYMEHSHPRPWMQGREPTLREMSRKVNQLQKQVRELEEEAEQGRAPGDMERIKLELRRSKQHKSRKLKKWENDYWHSVAEQAEQAEHRGDSYALYKVMAKLRTRGTAKKHIGERHIAADPFAEADSWRTHFRSIQNGVQPVSHRVWQNITQAETVETSPLTDTPSVHRNPTNHHQDEDGQDSRGRWSRGGNAKVGPPILARTDRPTHTNDVGGGNYGRSQRGRRVARGVDSGTGHTTMEKQRTQVRQRQLARGNAAQYRGKSTRKNCSYPPATLHRNIYGRNATRLQT